MEFWAHLNYGKLGNVDNIKASTSTSAVSQISLATGISAALGLPHSLDRVLWPWRQETEIGHTEEHQEQP